MSKETAINYLTKLITRIESDEIVIDEVSINFDLVGLNDYSMGTVTPSHTGGESLVIKWRDLSQMKAHSKEVADKFIPGIPAHLQKIVEPY